MDYFAKNFLTHKEVNKVIHVCYFFEEEATEDFATININLNDPK